MRITNEERQAAAKLPITWQEKVLLAPWFMPAAVALILAAIQTNVAHWVFDANAASVLNAEDLDNQLGVALITNNLLFLPMIWAFFKFVNWYGEARYALVARLRVIDLRLKRKFSRKKGEAK